MRAGNPKAERRSWRERAAAVLGDPRLRLALLSLFLAGAVVLVVTVGGPNRAEIEETVRDAGVAGPLVYLTLYVVLTVLMFPGAVMTAAGGVLFGPAIGTLLAVVGATLGSAMAFLLAKRLGRQQVERIAGRRIGRLDAWLERRGFLAVLYLRLVPVVPFNALNYAAGVTGLSFRDFAAATALGIIPGTFAFAALGGSFEDPTSPVFLTAVGLLVALVAGGPLINRIIRTRGIGPPQEAEDDDAAADGPATTTD